MRTPAAFPPPSTPAAFAPPPTLIPRQAAGRPPLSSRERAVAIRSLIVATASQSAEAALDKALADVEAFRWGAGGCCGTG